MAQKRERSVNFSREEVDTLIKLVEKNKLVIENKKSDAVTWAEKERCWKSIEIDFNSASGVTFRSAKTLRLKYEGIKRDTRKKSALIRAETYQTGGGPSSAPVLTPSEVKVKEMILLSIDGMDSKFDSDHLPNTVVSFSPSQNTCSSSGLGTVDTEKLILNIQNQDDIVTCPSVESEEVQCIENNIKETPVRPLKRSLFDHLESNSEGDENNKRWSQWKPASLKSKKHPALCIPKPKKPFERVAESKLEIIELQKTILEEELINNRKKFSFEEKEMEQRQKEWEEQKKRWNFEEEERQHKRELWEI
ncbi:fibrinogen silencer-binding protein-like [Melitaea cinxia]|uniref:fibrinogen silencer-binding protein-like n=1 Tax=Melitaea cinxia TaxID=113334 RepID=UPI001E27216D|nr:fibrinogen silencer-binding protein-like [Melitaea cinxia]